MFESSGYDRLVIGYHGTDQRIVHAALRGKPLKLSENPYDWLGAGVYFWEYGPKRALDWAVAYSKIRPDRIKKPAVLGAYIKLGRCFDLMDTAHTHLLRDMFPAFCNFQRQSGEPMPVNSSPAKGESKDLPIRYLDCAVINWTLDELAKVGERYDTVRSAFWEGDRIFEGTELRLKSHIQMAVRNEKCILGYFIPGLTGGGFKRKMKS